MKPFYSVHFDARVCNMRISINGVPLICMEVEGQCSTRYPFNHLLLESGLVTIKCEVRPLKRGLQLHKEAFLSMSVELFDLDLGYQPVLTMASYETPPQEGFHMPSIVHEEVFQVSLPYSLPGWKQSVKLDRSMRGLKNMAIDKYNEVIGMIKSHDFSYYEEAFRERENILGECYYLSDEEKSERMKSVEEVIINCTEVVPISFRDYLEFAADGRLIRLIKEDGDSSLRLRNNSTKEETSIDMWLHMRRGSNILTII